MKRLISALWPLCVVVLLAGGLWELNLYNQKKAIEERVKRIVETKMDLEQNLASLKIYNESLTIGIHMTEEQKSHYLAIKDLVKLEKEQLRSWAAEGVKASGK